MDSFGVWSPIKLNAEPPAQTQVAQTPKKWKHKKHKKKVIVEPPVKTTEMLPADFLKYKKTGTFYFADLQLLMKLMGTKMYYDPDYVWGQDLPRRALRNLSHCSKQFGDPQDNTVAFLVDMAMQHLEQGQTEHVLAILRYTEVYDAIQLEDYENQGFSSFEHWIGYQIVSLAVSQNLLTAGIAVASRLKTMFGPHEAVSDLLFKAIALHPLEKKATLIKLFASIENLTEAVEKQPKHVIEQLLDWARFQQQIPTPANELVEYLLDKCPQKIPHTSFMSLLCQNLENGNPWAAAYLWYRYDPQDLTQIPHTTLSWLLKKLTPSPELHFICRDVIKRLDFDYSASLGASVIEFCAHTKQLELGKGFVRKWESVAIGYRPRHVITAMMHFAVVSRDSEATDELSQEIKRRDGRLTLYETQLLVTHMIQQSEEQGLEYISRMDENVAQHMYAAVADILKDSNPELAWGCIRRYQQFMKQGGMSPDQHVIDSFAETQMHLVLSSKHDDGAGHEALSLIQNWVAFDGRDLRTMSTLLEDRPSRESRMRMLFSILHRCTRKKGEVYNGVREHLWAEGLSKEVVLFVSGRRMTEAMRKEIRIDEHEMSHGRYAWMTRHETTS